MPTFDQNMEILHGLRRARDCALFLCKQGIVVRRVRISNRGVMVEIDRPLDINASDIETKNGYAATPFAGCSVAWKLPEETQNAN